MKTPKPISPFRLSSLLRSEKDPTLAFNIFKNPNPDLKPPGKPFRYSPLSYDLIITKLGRARMFDEMEQVLHQLKNDARLAPEEIIFCNAMKFYGRACLHERARQLFEEMPEYRCQRTVKSVNSLLNALLLSEKFDEMKQVFFGMEKYARPDACTYNILIRACCLSGCLDDASNLFDEMQRKGVKPNAVTFGTLIQGLCMEMKVKEAFKLKADMVRLHGLCPSPCTYSMMIKGLCRIGELSLAIRLKEEMVGNKMKVDSSTYSTLISGLFNVGRQDKALGIFEEMALNECKPGTVTYNAMINGFCKVKDFEAAYRVLEDMAKKQCKPDVISYNILIGGLCKEGKWSEANDLFEDMPRQGCKPDVVSYRLLFDGLCGGLQFKEAAFIMDEMIFKGYVPHCASIHKFVSGLCQKADMKLLLMVLNSLAKANAIDQDAWLMVISKVCQEDKLSISSEILDALML
ncbi:putative pentatricopeptide repeat-containing protein At1g53330 [Herrania umbratica]|uniref:Pentatricopeptide repeat-containing protein At1g53330 n=1 Tax=Herrania umbratica TaxID=108875 RepID=A0A6J1AME1_9ROSI|nr:putative pentatricopeptide repeat-containing protein At1g53330 [Herrania umbratica]